MGWVNMLQLEWDTAASHFNTFRVLSKWSRCFAQYLIGACKFEAGDYQAASAAFKDMEKAVLDGPSKTASDVEKWAMRRSEAYYAAEAAGVPGPDRMMMPGLELAHAWNCFSQMTKNAETVATVQKQFGDAPPAQPTTPMGCLRLLLRASFARHAGKPADCIAIANLIDAASAQGVLKKSPEFGVVAFARWERGLAKLAMNQPGPAKVDFIMAKKIKIAKLAFSNRLSAWIKESITACGDAGPADDSAPEVDEEMEQKLAKMQQESGISLEDDDDDDTHEDGAAGATR